MPILSENQKWKLYNFYRDKTSGWRSIYYSLFGEDSVINAILGNKKNGFYVDVGAFHPDKYSNTKFFYKKNNWTGINIEPNPESIKLFESKRSKDINLNIGIAPEKSELEYFMFEDGLYNTFSNEFKNELEAKGIRPISSKKVQVVPLEEILEKYVKDREIDVLDIDVENLDYEVLISSNWEKYKPNIVAIEDHSFDFEDPMNSKIYSFLKQQGYILDSKCHYTLIFKKASL